MLSVNQDARTVRAPGHVQQHINSSSQPSQNHTQSPSSVLMSKFRGCLTGVLVGDCLGSPFENDTVVPRAKLEKFIAKQLEEQSEKLPPIHIFNYTDDTAMTKSIAQSLIEMKKFDPKDMAKRFALEYNNEPKRGYGRNVVDVFAALMLANYEHPYEPAKRQFNGKGSYGNGGAMRSAPIALYCFNMDITKLVELTRDSARITHSNSLGYNGAILQCLAVHQALHTRTAPNGTFDVNNFLDALIDKISKVELETSPNSSPNHHQQQRSQQQQQQQQQQSQSEQQQPQNGRHPTPFTDRLRRVKEILQLEKRGINYSVERIVSLLGNDVSALKSVPTAIYAAMKSQLPLDGFEHGRSPFVRTLFYACNLGGDVDTIASMACSIAGALYGYESIPKMLLRHCEGIDIIEKYADDLLRIVREMRTQE